MKKRRNPYDFVVSATLVVYYAVVLYVVVCTMNAAYNVWRGR